MSEQTVPSFPTRFGLQSGRRPATSSVRFSHRAQAFNLLLAVAVAMHLLFDGTYIIQGLAYSNVVKFGFLGLLLILAVRDGGPVGRPAFVVILVYAGLSLQSILVVPGSENLGSSLWGAEKFLYRTFLTFWALSRCFQSRLVSINAAINTWLGMALYFSVTGIAVFFFVYLLGASLPSVDIDLPRIGGTKSMMIGFGFADGFPRIQSFFSEANKFAQFLVFPFFLLLAMRSTLRNRFMLLVVALAFVLTFSAAAAVGLLFGLVLWIGLRVKTRSMRWALLGGGSLLLALAAVYVALGIWASYEYRPEDHLYYRTVVNKYGSLEATISNIRYGLQLANQNPLGIGMIGTSDSLAYGFGSQELEYNTASGIAQVLGRSGWPGIFLYGVIFLVAWRALLWYAAQVRAGAADPKGLALGVAYFALLVAATNFGPYDQRTLIITLALFFAYVHRHKMLRKDR